MKKISRENLKCLYGGLFVNSNGIKEDLACCEVTCSDGKKKSRECGDGTMCVTSGTTITCGTSSIDVCAS